MAQFLPGTILVSSQSKFSIATFIDQSRESSKPREAQVAVRMASGTFIRGDKKSAPCHSALSEESFLTARVALLDAPIERIDGARRLVVD
jgi:hypothetical protein